MVSELRQKVSGRKASALAAGGKDAPVPMEEQGMRHLVLEFLLHRGFGCSAAVFSPEADVPSSAMARNDMLKILGVSPSSSHFLKIVGENERDFRRMRLCGVKFPVCSSLP